MPTHSSVTTAALLLTASQFNDKEQIGQNFLKDKEGTIILTNIYYLMFLVCYFERSVMRRTDFSFFFKKHIFHHFLKLTIFPFFFFFLPLLDVEEK